MARFIVRTGPYRAWERVCLHQIGDGGKTETAEIDILFRLPSDSEFESEFPDATELVGSLADSDPQSQDPVALAGIIAASKDLNARARRAIAARIEDIKGLVDEEGEEIACSADIVAALMDYSFFAEPVAEAFHRARAGRKAKN